MSTEGMELVVPTGRGKESLGGRFGLVDTVVDWWHSRKEKKRVLTENERALKRMSDIAWRLRSVLDGYEFKRLEEQSEVTREGGQVGFFAYLLGVEEGFGYGVRTLRDVKTGQARMIEVYTRPTDIENYTTGMGDGYWRIYFYEDFMHKPKKGEQRRLEWSNTAVHGDVYLGTEARGVIGEVSVDRISTRVRLEGVSFGSPSVYVTLNARSKDELGSYLGPIGEVNELWVHGLARTAKPSEGHIMDSESITVPVNNNFRGRGVEFNLC